MSKIALEAQHNINYPLNSVSEVEVSSDCRVVEEENQGQKKTFGAVPCSKNFNTDTLNNIRSSENFTLGKCRSNGMGHPGLLFHVSNGNSEKIQNLSFRCNLEIEKRVNNRCSRESKSFSDETLALNSYHEKINGETLCKIKSDVTPHDSWYRTWPERGPDKLICRAVRSQKNLHDGCQRVLAGAQNHVSCLNNKENGASFFEAVCDCNKLQKNKTCSRSVHKCSPSLPVDNCELISDNLEVDNLIESGFKCLSAPVSLSRLLESMPSLAYNPVTKGLQLAVTPEREDEVEDIPRCKPAIKDEEEIALSWGRHHPGCIRHARLEMIEEDEEEEDRRKASSRQETIPPSSSASSQPARPQLPSTSSSSASLSSVSSLSTSGAAEDTFHGDGLFSASGSTASSISKEGRRNGGGLSGFFTRNLFAWKLSKEGNNGNSGVCEGSAPGWKLFGKVPPRQVPAARDPAVIAEEFQMAKSGNSDVSAKIPNGYQKHKSSNMQKLEAALINGCILPNGLDWGNKNVTITNSTTALILENRPPNLPAKSAEEEERHRIEYQLMLDAARKKELKEAKKRKKRLQQQLKMEEQLANAARIWNTEILPKWETMKNSRKARDLWWQGIPPSVRGKVWRLSISNDLNITPELYEICVSRAQERLRAAESSMSGTDGEGTCNATNGDGVTIDDAEDDGENPDKESSVELIQLDISRTFPHLCIFQEGGPYYDILHSLIGAYVCYRPDVGYVQGMSFLAAVLILNMDAPDAFICFANLLNRPCHIAFFRLKEPVMEAYYATYKDFFRENLPRLCQHFDQQGLSPDLYLLEWLYTVFSKAMPLDIACRVWDVFLRDGEEFLFRMALGVLHLNQDLLLSLDFIRGAQFLTRLPDDLSSDGLFKSVESIRMNIGKMKFQDILTQHLEQSKSLQPINSRTTRPQTPS